MTRKYNRARYLFPAGFDPRAARRGQRVEARRVTDEFGAEPETVFWAAEDWS